MSNEIRIFDRSGREMEELQVKSRRSWILNDFGDCVFPVSSLNAKAREEVLQYGNLIVVSHDELIDWSGVIDLDPAERKWRGGSVDITAYTMEFLLKASDTPIQKVSGTVGSIFRQIIDSYNQDAELTILPGEIWLGGSDREETLGDSCYVHVKRITERSGCDWNISHRLEGGKLKLYANLYERAGVQTGRLLFDGSEGNIEKLDPTFAEVGPIYNIVTGYSDASTSGKRLSVTLRNEESIKLFGRRRTSLTFSGVKEITTLTQSTQSVLDGYAFPQKQTAITVLNKGSIYPLLERGNIFDLSFSAVDFNNGEIGFDGEIRMFSMQYDGTPDKVKAGVRVVR